MAGGMPSARASTPAISAAVISHGSFEPSSSAAAQEASAARETRTRATRAAVDSVSSPFDEVYLRASALPVVHADAGVVVVMMVAMEKQRRRKIFCWVDVKLGLRIG